MRRALVLVTTVVGLIAAATSSGAGAAVPPYNLPPDFSAASFTINDGAAWTNTPNVTLNMKAPDGMTELLIGNDGNFEGSAPQPYAVSVPWKLKADGDEQSPKTVYLRFRSGPYSSSINTDWIYLDEHPPVVDAAKLSGHGRKWNVALKAHDSGSGVTGVQVAVSKAKPGKLMAFRKKITVKSARPNFVRVRDRAGSYSRWKPLRAPR